MLPIGMKIYLICFIVRQIALISFIISTNYLFMWFYVGFLIPSIYLIIAMFSTRFDKLKLFKEKID